MIEILISSLVVNLLLVIYLLSRGSKSPSKAIEYCLTKPKAYSKFYKETYKLVDSVETHSNRPSLEKHLQVAKKLHQKFPNTTKNVDAYIRTAVRDMNKKRGK